MKSISLQEVSTKIYRYCAYQERCHREVETKLKELGCTSDQADEIISHLIKEGFLNEERFARIYAVGKFRLKHWGRLRIIRELENRDLSTHCIRAGLSEINADDYHSALQKLLQKKIETTDASHLFELRDRVSKYAIHKGFEPDLVWEVLRMLLPNK